MPCRLTQPVQCAVVCVARVTNALQNAASTPTLFSEARLQHGRGATDKTSRNGERADAMFMRMVRRGMCRRKNDNARNRQYTSARDTRSRSSVTLSRSCLAGAVVRRHVAETAERSHAYYERRTSPGMQPIRCARIPCRIRTRTIPQYVSLNPRATPGR
jgi:hypothetical protein